MARNGHSARYNMHCLTPKSSGGCASLAFTAASGAAGAAIGYFMGGAEGAVMGSTAGLGVGALSYAINLFKPKF